MSLETSETKVTRQEKFKHPDLTAKGEERAVVALTQLKTLWFNTGSLCNITCKNCYMESSPTNDDLAYLTLKDVTRYLDEIARENLPVEEVAFTGGEPFMNKAIIDMLEAVLSRGYKALVLTNAMKPLWQKRDSLLALKETFGSRLSIRVSIDHYTVEKHEAERGADTWGPMIKGLKWLAEQGFSLSIAGRTLWGETDETARAGYRALFQREGIRLATANGDGLVLFPEMDGSLDVPEITIHCWDILGVAPEMMMCATSRMIVKRKGESPVVVPCTLLPYDKAFEMGPDLSNAAKTVKLNHPHCSRFCVLGGGSCTAK